MVRLDDVLDSLDGGVEVVDAHWVCVYRNSFCSALHVARGRAPDYGMGHTLWEVYPALAGTDVETAFRRTMEKRETTISRHAWPTPQHEVLIRAFATRDGGISIFFRDVTESKRIDEREAFLLRLSDRIRALSDPRGIMNAAAELLAKHLALSFVQYGVLLDEDSMEIVAAYSDGRLPGIEAGVRYKFSERAPMWKQLSRAGMPIYTEDREADVRGLNQGGTAAIAMRAGASIPLVKDGRLVAVLGVGLAGPRSWSVSDKELLTEVAERTWAAVERARVQSALRESENKYRTLFQEMEEAFALAEVVRDAKGEVIDYRYLEFNQAIEKHTGIKPERALGRLRSEVFPGIPPGAMETYRRVVATQKPERVEFYEPALDRWLALHAFPRGDERFATLYSDITARKLSDERQKYLLELSDRLRPLRDADAILAAATAAVSEKLETQRAYYVEYAEDLGTATIRYEHMRTPAPSLKGVIPLAAYFKAIGRRLAQGEPSITNDWETIDAPPEAIAFGRERHIRAQLVIPLLKEGKLTASMSLSDSRPRKWLASEVAILQETAERTWAALERAKAESALRALLAQAETSNRAKDEFLATLSHELRTPLAAILLWAQALRTGKVAPSELNRAIDAIAQSAESQSQLIDDLLDLSRLTAGKLVLNATAIDVGAVARAAIDVVRPIIEDKKLTLVVDIPLDLGRAKLDGARFKQILWNLLSNAVKFTPEGGTVTLRLEHNAALEIEVSDTGEGIAPELLSRVFEKFWQAEMGEARQHMGLGIGLALVKQLVELHGGTIEALSEGRGRGATFRASLPWIPAQNIAAANAPPVVENALAGLVVLLVEDDSNTRTALTWMLENAGASVVAVGSAQEALGALDGDAPPTVIVCDLGLPEVSGYELIEKINQDYRKRGIAPPPSCAVSAHARDADRERAIAAGFDMYLAKPIVPKRLIEAVTDLGDVLRRAD